MKLEMYYESPLVEILEIDVEKGFAGSGDGSLDGTGENGGWVSNRSHNSIWD